MNKKVELFEAAQRIINSKGVSYLTLENIAKEAGMSKGGLLYHYPNKNALIEGGIKMVLESYAEAMEAHNNKENENGHFVMSYAEVSLNNPQQLTSGLLAAISTNPDLLKPIQDYYDNWQHKIEEDGLDPVLATIIRLAIDGLWFCDVFGLAPPEENLRKDILDRLNSLTKEKE